MTTFQTLSIIISAIALLSGIISVHVSMRIAVAKIEINIKSIERDMLSKEIALLNFEKCNREDHKEIISKVDKIIDRTNLKI